jgi:hypothetical protein
VKYQELELIFGGTSFSPNTASEVLLNAFTEHFSADIMVEYYDKPCKLGDVPKRVKSSKRTAFQFVLEGIEVHFGSLPAYKHSFITIADTKSQIKDWRLFINALCPRQDFFLARKYEHLYDFWQNTTDVRGVVDAGLPIEDLRFIRNEMFNVEMIDINANPGRRVLQIGYVEAIGSEMWLGPNYFAHFPGVKSRLPAGWIAEENNNFLHIVAFPEVFTQPTGEQRLIQEALRAAIFPD